MTEKLLPAKFTKGDLVRLRQPGEHRTAFKNPRGVLEVADVHWFRIHEPPTYVLQEPGGMAVTPFREGDLVPATRYRGVGELERSNCIPAGSTDEREMLPRAEPSRAGSSEDLARGAGK